MRIYHMKSETLEQKGCYYFRKLNCQAGIYTSKRSRGSGEAPGQFRRDCLWFLDIIFDQYSLRRRNGERANGRAQTG